MIHLLFISGKWSQCMKDSVQVNVKRMSCRKNLAWNVENQISQEVHILRQMKHRKIINLIGVHIADDRINGLILETTSEGNLLNFFRRRSSRLHMEHEHLLEIAVQVYPLMLGRLSGMKIGNVECLCFMIRKTAKCIIIELS